MIVHYAEGALGNQLFNYAAARTLADRHGTGLLIDASSYPVGTPEDAARPFLLPRFPVRAEFRNHGPGGRRSLLERVHDRLRIGRSPTQVQRGPMDIGYLPGFEDLPGRAILRGHFIARRFFEGNADRIRQDLAPPLEAITAHREGAQLTQRIRATPAVSVHVRRGEIARPGHWLLLDRIEDYYRAAIRSIAEAVPGAVFYVFSDDPSWCREKLGRGPHELVIASDGSDRGDVALAEFCLMTLCPHHIIGNSAFSWWPAWLSGGAGRVLAPHLFDREGRIDVDTLYPPSWERIRW